MVSLFNIIDSKNIYLLLCFIIIDRGSDDSDGDDEYKDEPDVDGQDFFDDIKITEEDERAIEMFRNK